MQKTVLASSLALAFSLYILLSPPSSSSAGVLTVNPPAAQTSQPGTASPSPKTPPPKTTPAKSPSKPVATTTTTPKPAPTPAPAPVPAPKPAGMYRDGSYTGSVADAYYGNVQVQVTVSGGKITNVRFLDYPQDRGTSIEINSQAMPYLISEAIQAQSANVNVVSGATATSGAFQQSLASALAQAKI